MRNNNSRIIRDKLTGSPVYLVVGRKFLTSKNANTCLSTFNGLTFKL